MGLVKQAQKRVTEGDRMLEHLSCEEKPRELGVALSEKEKAGETILQSFNV